MLSIELVKVDDDKLGFDVDPVVVTTLELVSGIVEVEVKVSFIVVVVVVIVCMHSRCLILSFFFLLHLTLSAT